MIEWMNVELARFLNAHTPFYADTAVWFNGRMPLREHFYLTSALPPLDFVSSVRAILLRGDEVMVIQDHADNYHIVPGGRREPGELLLATLRREVAEETGWTLANPCLLGVVHFHHLAPEPDGYAYPYPDFLHVIYTAQAGERLPDAQIFDEYVVEAEFWPVADVWDVLPEGQRRFLATAVNGSRREV